MNHLTDTKVLKLYEIDIFKKLDLNNQNQK
jgi:hypothetical protein